MRDVAQVQGKPYGLADKLSKLIPFEVGMTLSKAMEDGEDLRTFVNENDEVSEIMDMAYKLEILFGMSVVTPAGRHRTVFTDRLRAAVHRRNGVRAGIPV